MGPALRDGVELVRAVGHHDAIGDGGDAVGVREAGQDLVLGDQVVIQRLEDVRVALETEVIANVHDVPGDLSGFDLRLDRGVRRIRPR